MPSPDKLNSGILKHDSKQNSYKIALIRAINDVVLERLQQHNQRGGFAKRIKLLWTE